MSGGGLEGRDYRRVMEPDDKGKRLLEPWTISSSNALKKARVGKWCGTKKPADMTEAENMCIMKVFLRSIELSEAEAKSCPLVRRELKETDPVPKRTPDKTDERKKGESTEEA